MGLRVRLRASFDTSGFGRQARVVLQALKRYGMLLADNGSPWYISGAPSRGWDNDDLHGLGRVRGSDFEVVDTSSLPQPAVTRPHSRATRWPTSSPPPGVIEARPQRAGAGADAKHELRAHAARAVPSSMRTASGA